MPEFYDIEVMRHVLSLIEEFSLLQEMFTANTEEQPIKVIFGAELGNKYLEPVSIVFTDLKIAGRQCYLGALGSNRFDYQYVVPMMRYFRNVIRELVSG
jgi:transcriptional regulator of heat shock response